MLINSKTLFDTMHAPPEEGPLSKVVASTFAPQQGALSREEMQNIPVVDLVLSFSNVHRERGREGERSRGRERERQTENVHRVTD